MPGVHKLLPGGPADQRYMHTPYVANVCGVRRRDLQGNGRRHLHSMRHRLPELRADAGRCVHGHVKPEVGVNARHRSRRQQPGVCPGPMAHGREVFILPGVADVDAQTDIVVGRSPQIITTLRDSRPRYALSNAAVHSLMRRCRLVLHLPNCGAYLSQVPHVQGVFSTTGAEPRGLHISPGHDLHGRGSRQLCDASIRRGDCK